VLFFVHETTIERSAIGDWEFVEGFNVLNKSNIISYSKQNGFYAYSYRCFIVPLHHTSLTHKGTLWGMTNIPMALREIQCLFDG
jgi:hypothetical protein